MFSYLIKISPSAYENPSTIPITIRIIKMRSTSPIMAIPIHSHIPTLKHSCLLSFPFAGRLGFAGWTRDASCVGSFVDNTAGGALALSPSIMSFVSWLFAANIFLNFSTRVQFGFSHKCGWLSDRSREQLFSQWDFFPFTSRCSVCWKPSLIC